MKGDICKISPINQAGIGDYLALLNEFRTEQKLPRSVMTESLLREQVMARHRRFAIHLAQINGSKIGFVSFQSFYEPSSGVLGLHLCDLFVKVEHRRCGIGQRLFYSCKKVALKTNKSFVWWVTRTDNFAMNTLSQEVGASYASVNSVFLRL